MPRGSPRNLILKNGRVLRAGALRPEQLDIRIVDGRVAALARDLPVTAGSEVLRVDGQLVAPGLIDVHQHLDKSRTRSVVSNPSGDLAGASAGYARFAASVTGEDMRQRAERTLEACVERGTVAIRSHTNIDPEVEVRGVEAMLELRSRWADRVRLQVVAHVTSGAARDLVAAERWLDEALAAGADAVGGVPAFATDPIAMLDMLFRAATRHGRPLDLHLDEHLDDGKMLAAALIERTRAHGMAGRVVAGHCSALSALDPISAARIVDGFAREGIAVVTLPAANLFLQGREADRLPPRGLTRVRDLLAAGVRVAAASDNVQDPFVPTGSGDLLEIARWTLLAGHLGLNDLRTAFDLVSTTPASIMFPDEAGGIAVGSRADFLITNAEDAEDLVASGPLQRIVVVAGRVLDPAMGA